MDFGNIMTIAIGSIFVNNFVLSRFLGLCPFIGCSKKNDSALGMGIAVTFVMAGASAVTYGLYSLFLFFENKYGIIGIVDVLKTLSYILVIATLVQLVEIYLKKKLPSLYRSLGIYLPLITTNCAVLGVALLNTTDAPKPLEFHEAVFQGFFGGIGFTVGLLLISGIRQRIELVPLPEALKGVPIAFICTGFMALSFMGFSGM